MSKKVSQTLSIIVFFAFIFILPILTVILPKETFSEAENKVLATFPKFSFDSVISTDFMTGIDSYVSDHFVFREDWIALKTRLELAQGKKELKGVYFLDDRLVQKFETPDYTETDKSINGINHFAQVMGKPVYVAVAPTSACIYSDELPKNSSMEDQKAYIDYIYNNLSEEITKVDLYKTLFSVRDEYVYYRTDHHWTTLGAGYAYKSIANAMGITPIPLEKFDVEHASSDFLGTFYSKVLYNGITPDVIDYYMYKDGSQVTSVIVNDGREEKEYNSMYFREFLSKKDKYSSFLGSNTPMVTVNSDNQGEKLLVIKDSYAHCFVPFMTQHFSKVTMIDLRYMMNPELVVDISEYDKVLVLYNAQSFSEDTNIKKLGYVKGAAGE